MSAVSAVTTLPAAAGAQTVFCAECVENTSAYMFNSTKLPPQVPGWTPANGIAALLAGVGAGNMTVPGSDMVAVTYYNGSALCLAHAHAARYK